MPESYLTYEKVFRYCDNNLSEENCPEIDEDIIFTFKLASKHIWNDGLFINLNKEITESDEPVQNRGLFGEPIKGSVSLFKTVAFYQVAQIKYLKRYNVELFRITRKCIYFSTNIIQKSSKLIDVCEERQEFFFIVYNEETSIPYDVFQDVASTDYSDLPSQDIQDTVHMKTIYFTSDNSNKQFPYFETKNGDIIHNLEYPCNRALNGSPYRLVLKPVNKPFAHTLAQFCELQDIEKMHDKNLLQYAPQKITEDTILSRSYSDYFIFIPRQLIK